MDLVAMQTRKRQRSEEDYDQSLPISKRINQLHLQPSGLEIGTQFCASSQWMQDTSGSWSSAGDHRASGSVVQSEGGISRQPSSSSNHLQTYTSHNASFNGQPSEASNAMGGAYASQVEHQQQQQQRAISNNVERYEPELTEAENPFYYCINGELFHLHMARLQRTRNI